jgi:hypothetical protein
VSGLVLQPSILEQPDARGLPLFTIWVGCDYGVTTDLSSAMS